MKLYEFRIKRYMNLTIMGRKKTEKKEAHIIVNMRFFSPLTDRLAIIYGNALMAMRIRVYWRTYV